MNTNPLRTSSVVIPAGTDSNPGSITAAIAGEVFICVIATSPFRMNFDSRGVFDCIQGAVIPVSGGFKALTFFNPTASAIVVQFGCGAAGLSFIPTNMFKVSPTYVVATNYVGGSALTAGTAKNFSGVNGLNLRKQITVQNLDAGGNSIEVQDSNGVTVAVIPALSYPFILETSSPLIIKNTSAQTVSRVAVSETFYS